MALQDEEQINRLPGGPGRGLAQYINPTTIYPNIYTILMNSKWLSDPNIDRACKRSVEEEIYLLGH